MALYMNQELPSDENFVSHKTVLLFAVASIYDIIIILYIWYVYICVCVFTQPL